MYSRLLSRLISQFMVQSSSYRNEMLKALWTTNKNAFIHGMVYFCRNSDQQAAALLRILEVIQELGLLLEVLNSKQDRHFTIDLAVLAAQNTGLPFANWASKAGEVGGDEFALAAVSYLRSRVYGGDTMNAKPGPSVPMEYASALLQVCMHYHAPRAENNAILIGFASLSFRHSCDVRNKEIGSRITGKSREQTWWIRRRKQQWNRHSLTSGAIANAWRTGTGSRSTSGAGRAMYLL